MEGIVRTGAGRIWEERERYFQLGSRVKEHLLLESDLELSRQIELVFESCWFLLFACLRVFETDGFEFCFGNSLLLE